MLKIETIAATPFPRVVEVEHCNHVALAHLHKQIVETGKDSVVILARRPLQRGLYLGQNTFLAVAAHEDAEIVDADAFHEVELRKKTIAVAATTLRTENGTIPEVGAYIIIWLAVAHEMTIGNTHKLLCRICLAALARNEGESCKHNCHKRKNLFHRNYCFLVMF